MQLEIQNISKHYGKDKVALKDYSITIKNGILGLLGPNGAGKSTLMKIIATISKPTSGDISLNGENLVKNPNAIRKVLGYLPQDFGVYPNLNAYEFLQYIAAMKGVGGGNLKQRIKMLLESVNLIEAAKRPIGTYSGGMKQRIGIAQVLLNDPKVLIFDEPTVGLDPEERVRFRNLLSDLSQDRIVILSSHIVSDIDTIADEVVVMKSGELISKGLPYEIIQEIEGKVFEKTMTKEEVANFKNQYTVISVIRQREVFKVRYIHEVALENAIACEASLEDVYLYLTKG